jgi:PHD/YefM family antitoxin component YafN of YafNO toxin-antitoxin module
MIETISTLEVRQRLGDIPNRVAFRNDQFIIERKGKPLAAVVPVERLEQMRRAARMHLLQVLERQEGKASRRRPNGPRTKRSTGSAKLGAGKLCSGPSLTPI